jgi:hypothetical protein
MTLARIRRRRRVPRVAAIVRRRSRVVAVGLALTATVGPAAAARADQAPAAGDGHAAIGLTHGAVQVPVDDLAPPPQPPLPPEPPEPPEPEPPVGPDDLAPAPDEPEPPLPPDPDPPVGPDDLANPTENPEPEPDPEPEPPADGGGQAIPTPDRVDTGLGGAAGQFRQPVVVLAVAATVLAVLLLVLATRRHATSTSGSAR